MFGGSTQGLSMGFTPTQAVESSPDRSRSRQEEKSTCLPVTIRLLEITREAARESGGEMRFHGADVEPSMLLLVAAVEAVHARQDTSLEFSVNDGTGRLKARHFITDSKQGSHLEQVVPGVYVSMFGHFRTAPAPHFSVTGMRLVRSADEVSFHMIEVAHAALRIQTKGLGNGASREAGYKEPATPAPKTERREEERQQFATPPRPQAMDTSGPEEPPKMPEPQAQPAMEGAALREAVLKALGEEPGEVGMTAQQVLERVQRTGAKVAGQEPAVKKLLALLVDEGDVFNTTDDDHFAAL